MGSHVWSRTTHENRHRNTVDHYGQAVSGAGILVGNKPTLKKILISFGGQRLYCVQSKLNFVTITHQVFSAELTSFSSLASG